MNNYSYIIKGVNIMCNDKCNNNIVIPTDDMIIELADTFKVFSDSSRIKILYSMINQEMCVRHISQKVNMSQSAVSHQLKTLKQARLIKYRKEGKEVYYSLDDEHIEKILNVVIDHIKEERNE